MIKKPKKFNTSVSLDADLLSWASESGNSSGFMNDVMREKYNATKKKDVKAMLIYLEEKLEKRANDDKEILKLLNDLEKTNEEDKKIITEEDNKKIEKYRKKYENDCSIMEKMEKDIKEHGLVEIANEMLNVYSKNNKMIENPSEMGKWKKKFKEKYPQFFWGNNLDSYCYHKGEKK